METFSSITLKLQGEKISSSKLLQSIDIFYKFIDEVAFEVFNKRKAIKWIVNVNKGSIELENRAELNTIDAIKKNEYFLSLGNGIISLDKEAETPKNFNDKALEYLRTLTLIPSSHNGVASIDIYITKERYPLTHHIIANIDDIVAIKYTALGSLEGRLQTLSERGKAKFIIYDALTDKGVYCFIDEKLMKEAISAFGKRVNVFGLIHYDKKGKPKSIQAEKFKIFRDQDQIPTAYDICGILKGVD